MAPTSLWRSLLAAALLAAGPAGCGGGGRPAPATGDDVTGTLTVLAASSLTDALDAIGAAFEAEHPGIHVALTFGGSSTLVAQVLEGVPADVLVAADELVLDPLAGAGRMTGDAVTVATNELEIVVAEGNPLGVSGLADLAARAGTLTLALCDADVPCGAYALEAFDRAGVRVPPAAAEDSVRGVLTKVQLGEADAGVVYRTDVLAATGVAGVALPDDQQVLAAYPAAVLADSPNPRAAAAFLAFLSGDDARAILADLGFGLP